MWRYFLRGFNLFDIRKHYNLTYTKTVCQYNEIVPFEVKFE